jgi:hypothetical protein
MMEIAPEDYCNEGRSWYLKTLVKMIYCRSGNSLKENPKMEKLRSAPPLLIGLLPYLSKYGEMIMWNSAYLEPFRC